MDQMAFYSVPKSMNKFINDQMSPKKLHFYRKNLEHLYTPNHEAMHGLIIGTRFDIPNGKIKSFNTVDEAEEYMKSEENTEDFWYNTQYNQNGILTNITRERVGQYFNCSINSFLEERCESNLTKDNIVLLYDNIEDEEDRLDRIKQMQDLGLRISTLSGQTAPKISAMNVIPDKDTMDAMRAIENSTILTDAQKELKIREMYDKYQKNTLKNLDKEVASQVTDSARAKVGQLMSIITPALTADTKGNIFVGETILGDGLSYRDYSHMAMEGRPVQDVKQSSVPLSGSLTRQFVFLASPYSYSNLECGDKKGVWLKRKDCVGRTTVDGDIIEENNDDTLVRVRSIVSTPTPNEPFIYKDMVTRKFLANNRGNANLGIALSTSFTESLTQAGLGLKHGAHLYNYGPNTKIVAKEDCTAEIEDKWLSINYPDGRNEKLPVAKRFVLNAMKGNSYKKGETIGVMQQMVSPAYRLDAIVNLCQGRLIAQGQKQCTRNTILMSECYAYNEGTIHYDLENLKVTIGDLEYDMNPDDIYLVPEGAYIKKYQRICAGILDIQKCLEKVGYEESFYHFWNQIREKSMFPVISSELIEFIYFLLFRKFYENGKVKKIVSLVQNSGNIYTSVAFENASKTFKGIDENGTDFGCDNFTISLLGQLLNE